MKTIDIEKMGSSVSRLQLPRHVRVVETACAPSIGDVVIVRALTESATYGHLELGSGRLAKINAGDVLAGTLGKRRALKGFVGDVPETINPGDHLHLLNMGGVIGHCEGHHSSLSDAIAVEVIGLACDEDGRVHNIGDNALPMSPTLDASAPVIVIAGTCMNSGKTVAATELIKQATNEGLRVAAGKVSGIACLRDTLNMEDHGAVLTASFLDCGLPSTVDHPDLPAVAKSLINYLNTAEPDLIVIELGDGIVGGYSVDSVLSDNEIRAALSSLVFCASDYVGVIGGSVVLSDLGLAIDVVAGSVTDSKMGEDYIRDKIGFEAGNARRDGRRLFELAYAPVSEAAVAAR